MLGRLFLFENRCSPTDAESVRARVREFLAQVDRCGQRSPGAITPHGAAGTTCAAPGITGSLPAARSDSH
jgi:hypothetical protein